MRFYAAQAHEKTTPTRLTGLGKNCSTIPVALLDQCFPHEESKTFGIEFRLPPTGGSCDDGLIICYLGSLATRTMDNVHSMNGLSVNSELFNVDNAVNNSLAKYCAGKLNVSWHGIKVHTEKLNGKNIIKLSTSLLEDEEQSFEMPDAQRQFIIYFGNENEFSAYATVDGGQQINLDDEKAEQYKKLAPKGAHLKDFVGFWTLGLDMLPWMDHEVELFVNRSCSCSMEAWDPKEPSTGIGGPKTKCIGNTTKEVPLNNNLKANHLIRIQMLIDGNALHNNISFELLDLRERIDLDVEKAKQYKQLALKGAHLKDFVGFWTLGLDVLPWMDHEVKLFVNRSCSCSMEAWDPKEPSTGIGGPKAKCIANTIKKVPLNNSLKANRLIRIQMLIDGNAKRTGLFIEILDLNKNPLMIFKMTTGHRGSIKMKGILKKKKMPGAHLPEGNGTLLVEFIIALTNYSYGFKMNGGLLGGQEYFPKNWWKGLPFDDMNSLRLSGPFLLLTEPLVMPFFYVQQNYEPLEQKPPCWKHISSILQESTNVIFRFKLASIDNEFNISFLHNRIESPPPGDLRNHSKMPF
uniref:FSA_C domain-containing protein n=1 Tax=Globodera pallida TaxID=36090 RepID=A0A183BNI2_GLOPA